jgi:hypothetical protein
MALPIGLVLLSVALGAEATVPPDVRTFVENHCIDCHGPDKQKGGKRFDTLDGNLDAEESGAQWLEILARMQTGDMPPEDAEQPSPRERKRAIDSLRKGLAAVASNHARRPGVDGVLFRRLTRPEYRNTIRDLVGINLSLYDPTATFPPDVLDQGFDKTGARQVTTEHLLDQYIVAADEILRRAIAFGPRPASKKVTLSPESFNLSLLAQRPRKMGYLFSRELPNGVSTAGEYIIRVKVETVGRKTLQQRGLGEPMQLGFMATHTRKAAASSANLNRRTYWDVPLASRDLRDQGPQTVEVRVWLDEDWTVRLTFPNGPKNPVVPKGTPKYVPKNGDPSVDEPAPKNDGTIPGVRVLAFEIEGPFYPAWPPASHTNIFGKGTVLAQPDLRYAEEILTRFGRRAFRRPVGPTDVGAYVALVDRQLKAGDDFPEAIRAGLRAMLCAPRFLYLVEPAKGTQAPGQTIDDFTLASRLSYFLWDSMPDETLLALAERRTLSQPRVLEAQVRRMLGDWKTSAFQKSFVWQWLRLRRLEESPPDPKVFVAYYDAELKPAMLTETELFFRHVLEKNLSIANFLDSSFSFVNDELAKQYDIAGVTGQGFRMVKLSGDHRRGGILGQGSILTLTTNGTETSPVARGVWVMENMLGIDPPPPPPSVEPIDPDTTGATNIREQLAKHRKAEMCNECHRRIDPLGFALENYDSTGRWRDRYDSRLAAAKKHKLALDESTFRVDASDQLADGRRFRDVTELKQLLLARKDDFARCLATKLLSYALGREIATHQRADVDQVVNQLRQKKYGLRDLVFLVATSPLFRTK